MIPWLAAPPQHSALTARAARLARLELTYHFQPVFRRPEAQALLAEPPGPAPGLEIVRGRRGGTAGLVQLGARPLLTPSEERHRFLRMNYARYLADRLRRELDVQAPDPQRVARIESLLALAQKDREEIVAANTRLVIALVRRCGAGRNQFEDLVSEGLETLLRAVDQFDPGRGFRFSTYATTAIRRTLVRALRRLQQHRQRQRRLGEEPLSEHGSEQGESASGLPAARLPRGGQEALPVRAGEVAPSMAAAALPWQKLLAALPPRERLVLTRRYALDGRPDPQTLQSLARELGVCKERVRQIELKARQRLRRQLEAGGWTWPQP